LLNWASKNFSSGDRTREVVEGAYGFCYEIGKKTIINKTFPSILNGGQGRIFEWWQSMYKPWSTRCW
jgi:hypothetical protein